MRPQSTDYTRCCFIILEGEDLEDKFANVNIGEFFLDEDESRPGREAELHPQLKSGLHALRNLLFGEHEERYGYRCN